MQKFKRKRLGDILVEAGLITKIQLKECLELQKGTNRKLGEILIEKGYVTQKDIAEVLEFQLGIPYINLSVYPVDPQTVRLIPENMARKHEIIPIKLENNILTVAASDPLNTVALDDVRIFTGFEVKVVMADTDKIMGMISHHFGSIRAIKAVEEFSKTEDIFARNPVNAISETDLSSQQINEAPAVKLINILIEQAVQSRASDIHIEPQPRNVRIRFRIDGQLMDIMQSDISILPSIVSRIKVISGMNIAEKRMPQDGRLSFKIGKREVDLRVSVLPSLLGEKIVIRIISTDTFNIPKEKLGFLPENLEDFDGLLKNPNGIILVTGPTGSGKTTTLYAAIKELNQPNVNIVTVEDPVESVIEGITQVQVNPRTGLTFANALRSILRQDPDIVLVGEIRDDETAEIAVRAAITGHLVLSTLHTNDASSSVLRLIDMGIQPFLVSASLVGVISQRLVRCICPNCKISYEPSSGELQQLSMPEGAAPLLYKGKGCQMCKGTGYYGRTAVHELMKINSELREAIYRGENAGTLKEIAEKNGMITLRENCRRLVLDGITTFPEMLRIAYLQE